MTGRLIGYDGKKYALPALLAWTLNYGTGTPCDSFEVRCPWGEKLDGALSDAVEFTAEEDGETVFRGVVDEYEWSCGSGGSTLLISGRGMAGRLLDNEAQPADYQTATLEDILRDHVTPYGIQTAEGASLPAVPGFSVESGSSEWQVLYNFARYYGGVEPRFDRFGILHLTSWQDGKRLRLDDSAAVEEVRWTEKRYGVSPRCWCGTGPPRACSGWSTSPSWTGAACAGGCSPCRAKAATRPCGTAAGSSWSSPPRSGCGWS